MDYFDGALVLWFGLTTLSLIYLLYDLSRKSPLGWVMKLAWFLVILYTGPIGLFFYLLTSHEPLPGTFAAFIKAHWKQAFGSELHCVAGDATGIIFMASITYFLAFPNGIDLILEYSSAFIFGLFIFQALFMLPMYGSYLSAVKNTFFSEFVSMNMVMVGMIPVMVVLRAEIPDGANPLTLRFWGIASIATLAGFVVAYPINSWLVRKGVKHGLMTKDMESGMQSHKAPKLSRQVVACTAVLTFGLLLAAVVITNQITPIEFT